MFERHWGPIFAVRPTDEDAMQHYLAFSVTAPADFDWHVSPAVVEAAISGPRTRSLVPTACPTRHGVRAPPLWRP